MLWLLGASIPLHCVGAFTGALLLGAFTLAQGDGIVRALIEAFSFIVFAGSGFLGYALPWLMLGSVAVERLSLEEAKRSTSPGLREHT